MLQEKPHTERRISVVSQEIITILFRCIYGSSRSSNHFDEDIKALSWGLGGDQPHQKTFQKNIKIWCDDEDGSSSIKSASN